MPALTLSLAPTVEAQQRLDRYERIRTSHGLPRLEVLHLKDCITLTWPSLPPVVPVDRMEPAFARRTLRWLVKLEEAWGDALGGRLALSDLRFDRQRQKFAVGPSLFDPSAADDLLAHLGTALGVDGVVLDLLDSFKQLALRAGLEGLDLDEATQVRMLVAAGRQAEAQGRFEAAERDARQAWELRPGDEDAGRLLLDASRRLSGRVGDPTLRAVADILSQSPDPSVDLLLTLCQHHLAWDEAADALRCAREASERDGSRPKVWRIYARAAQRMRDAALVMRALESGARLGDRNCLRSLVRVAPPAVWRPIVREWSGPVDALVLGLKVQDNVVEHRFSRALREALHRPELLEELDAAAFQALERASSAVRGGSLRLRELLLPLANAGQNEALVSSYARLCLRDGQPAELLRLDRRSPGQVDARLLLQAHQELGDWDEVLRRSVAEPRLGGLRLRALQQLATGEGRLPQAVTLRACLEDLRQHHGLEPARELHAQLAQTLADHPFTGMLGSALSELEDAR